VATEARPNGSEPRGMLKRLVGYLRPYRLWATVSVLLLLFHSTLGVAGPYLTKVAVDCCLLPDPEASSFLDPWLPADPREAVIGLALLYALILAIGAASRALQIQTMNRTGQRVMADLRNEIYAHLQRMSVSFFDRNRVGVLVTRLTSDVDTLNDLFTSGVAAIAGDLITLALIVGAMAWMSPHLTGTLLIVAPPAIVASWIFRKHSRQAFRATRQAVGSMNAFLQEQIVGMTVVQTSTYEGRSRARLAEVNDEQLAAGLRTVHVNAWFLPTAEFLSSCGVVVVLLAGAWFIEDGVLTLGVMVAFLQYGARVFRPLQDLSDKFNVLQNALSGAERIFGLLDEPPEEPDSHSPDSPKRASRPVPTVEFENVWFAYKDEEWVLRDVSFRVEPSEVVAVVGHTGAGKTSLISLLLRFYEPQKGRILVDGKDVREWPRHELRRLFGVVLQDPYLFHGSIEENIRLGGETVTAERAVEAGKQAHLEPLVRGLEKGWQHPVGEDGASMSAGQKQLIAMARALAHSPQFLILDEATSNIDPETERKIRDTLSSLVEGHTAIVIAHRLSTIRRATRILVMHHGRLRESGTHQELLAAEGLYSRLYRLQFSDQDASADG